MNNRAYSLLTVKSVDDGSRTISGVATTPSVDRVGDIIDPLGVQFKNPMPLLWQHQHDMPVGSVKFDKPTKNGINFTAEFVNPDEVDSPTLKDRLQMAWDSVKTQLVRAVSIGFRPLEYSFLDNGGVNYIETEVYELSAVTIPANSDAIITAIKAFTPDAELNVVKALDAEVRHEAGIPDPEIPSAPAPQPEGKKAVVVRLGKEASAEAPFVINKIHTGRG